MKLLSGLMFLLSVGAELCADAWMFDHWIRLASLMHLLACCCMIAGAYCLLARRFLNNDWRFYAFLGVLNLCLVNVGFIISFFIVLAMYRLYLKAYQGSETLDDSINLGLIYPILPKYGAGGATLRLLGADASMDERTKALFTIGQSELTQVNTLMYQLLADTSDDIRLLAIKIIDAQEEKITTQINQLIAKLHLPEITPFRRALLQKNISRLFWDLIYHRLILPELEVIFLKRALEYAVLASKILVDDPGIWILLGKIYQHLHEDKLAQEAFNKITHCNVPSAHSLPYLAEMSYRQGDYVRVKRILASADTLVDVPLVAPVKAFWDKT